MTLSIGKAWEDARAFIMREHALLVPVALLLIGVPLACLFQLVPDELRMMNPQQRPAQLPEIPPENLLGMMLAGVTMLLGSLALYALCLRPHVSVADAIRLAVRRLPVAIGATLLIAFALAVPLIVVAIASPNGARLLMLVLGVFISVRTMMLSPVIVERPVGAAGAVREAWRATQGHFFRLGLFVLIVSLPVMLAQMVAQLVFGLIGHLLGGAQFGAALADIAVALTMAGGQIVVVTMTAQLYRQAMS